MSADKNRVCPVELAGGLDHWIRHWIQNPNRILSHHVQEGMVVLDVGCGPGYFTVPMAKIVGATGKVIACDMQEGMLDKVRGKIQGTELEDRIQLHLCSQHHLGLSEPVDFVLAFYMMHEVPDQERLLGELASILRPTAGILVVEPPFHVSHREFEVFRQAANSAGLQVSTGPRLWPNRTALLTRRQP